MRKINVIVHLWTAGPFMEESTYQETMLANSNRKYHDKVYIVTTNMRYGLDDSVTICNTGRYTNSHGVEIVRLNTHKADLKSRHDHKGIFEELSRIKPDFILNHDLNPTSCFAIHRYKKINPACKITADCHMTRANSFGEKLSLGEMRICALMRLAGLICYKDIDKFYGITTQSVKIMTDLYGVPRDRAECLPLGYDSDIIRFEYIDMLQSSLRNRYQLSADTKIFVSGGKLTPAKKTFELVKAFRKVENAFLIVFGEFVDSDYEKRVKDTAGDNVAFTGGLDAKQIYDLYLGCDIAIFPGNPSCLRQEAVACGLPIIMACYEGDEDINIIMDSNGVAVSKDWTEYELISTIYKFMDEYGEYRDNAMKLAKGDYTQFSYDKQAEYILYN